jgi:hypothetical protein
MASERQPPDAILASTNLSGSVSDIDDDPDSPDSNWLTATVDGNDTMVRVSFPTPTGDPTTGAGLQEFRFQVRNTNNPGGNDPSYSIHLYENGSDLGEIASGTVVSSTGEVLSAIWDASSLGTADGSLVEAYIYGTVDKKDSMEVGAVEWNVEYSAGTIHEGEGQSAGGSTAAADGNVEHTGGGQADGGSSATASGTCVFAGSAQSDGGSTSTADGNVEHTGQAQSDGISTTTATGTAIFAGAAQSDGLSTGTASGSLDLKGQAQSDGLATATGTAEVIHTGAAQSDGTSTATGTGTVGGQVHEGQAQSDGLSTATGTASLDLSGEAQSDGLSTVIVAGYLDLAGAAQSDGTSTATGTGSVGGVIHEGATESVGCGMAWGLGLCGALFDVVCTIGVEELHRYEDYSEEKANGVVATIIDFSSPSISWTNPEPNVWEGTGDRKMEIVSA